MQRNTAYENWNSGKLLNVVKAKKFNFTENPGIELLEINTYFIEVFPSVMISKYMGLVVNKLFNDGDIGFIAQISFSDDLGIAPIELRIKSLRNGIYAHETVFPKQLFCLRETPLETVVASLNNAWEKQHWCPVY